MPIATLKTRAHTVYVWELLDGDVAHEDGYAVASVDSVDAARVTLPLEMIEKV